MTTAKATIHYPTKARDLAVFDLARDLYRRPKDGRVLAQYRIGYRDDDLARLLGCTVADVHGLHNGVLDTIVTAEGAIVERGEIDLPPSAQKLLHNYRRFLTACEQLPPRALAEPAPDEVAALQVGKVDAIQVASLKTGLDGFLNTYAGRRMTPVQRVQALHGLSVASFAAALGQDVSRVFEWLTAMRDIPTGDDAEEFFRALSFLATGPELSKDDAKRKPRSRAVAEERCF